MNTSMKIAAVSLCVAAMVGTYAQNHDQHQGSRMDHHHMRRHMNPQTGVPTVMLDGEKIDFPNHQPMMDGDHVLVPLRGVFEKAGATVEWHRDDNNITARLGDRRVMIPVNGTKARVNGQDVTLDQPAEVVDGTLMVPLRFLGEALGATVDWRATDMTVMMRMHRG